ncbi:MAG: hypothetical protein ACE5ID_04845 [Acidobacteriota bacterium]
MGKIRVRILDLPTTWDPFVSSHYAPFAEPAHETRAADLTLTCHQGEGVIIPLPGPGEVPVIDVDRRPGDVYRIRSHWQDGQMNLQTGQASITLTDLHEMPLRMSLENFLRVACQLLLLQRHSFLLHSAGILDEGRCFLFFGHSGAGKSTVTRLSQPRRALSDDLVLVDADPAAARIHVHAVPFFGAFPLKNRVRGHFPLAAAFRIRQDASDRIEPLSTARAAATLSASIPFVHELGATSDQLTDLVTHVVRTVAVKDLYFTLSTRFWDLIHAQGASGPHHREHHDEP